MNQSPFETGARARPGQDWFSAVYQAVDTVLDRREGNVPPGTLATLYRALDELRGMAGYDGHVRRGGAIVVTLHRLQSMLRDHAQPVVAAELRRDLAVMQREWLVTAPIRH